VDGRTLRDLHTEHGLDFPQRAIFAAFADMTFLSAQLPR
jgi:hypothetical protein